MQGWRMIQKEFVNAAIKEIERFPQERLGSAEM